LANKKNKLVFCKADPDESFGLPKSIPQVEKEARELGLSYGKYVYGVHVTKDDIERAKKRRREIAAYDKRMEACLRASRAGMRGVRSPKSKGTNARPHKGGKPPVRVQRLGADGEILATYDSVSDASRTVGTPASSITAACVYYRKKTAALANAASADKAPAGFRWRYAPNGED